MHPHLQRSISLRSPYLRYFSGAGWVVRRNTRSCKKLGQPLAVRGNLELLYSYASFKMTDLTRKFASNPPSLLHTTYEMATRQLNKHTDTLTRQEVINYRYMKGLKPPQIKEKTSVSTLTIRRILRLGNAKSNY